LAIGFAILAKSARAQRTRHGRAALDAYTEALRDLLGEQAK